MVVKNESLWELWAGWREEVTGSLLRLERRKYSFSGGGVKFDLHEVLSRSQGPTVGRMRLLAT